MNKNIGMKVTLTILVIICIVQIFTISSLKDTVEDLENRLFNVERQARENKNNIMELWSNENGEALADYNFGINGVDLVTGQVEFEFVITPYDITDNMKIKVSNTIEEVELTKSGNSFVGTLNYPMDDKTYETTYYIYEGDYETTYFLMDWLGSGLWADKCVYAGFEGITSYGNGKLTLAGNIEYYINVEDEIVASKLVFKDNEIELDNKAEGNVNINFSEKIRDSLNGENFKELYIEYEMKSGYVYRVYPYINADLTYGLQSADDKSEYIYQSDMLEILKDGEVLYNMNGY